MNQDEFTQTASKGRTNLSARSDGFPCSPTMRHCYEFKSFHMFENEDSVHCLSHSFSFDGPEDLSDRDELASLALGLTGQCTDHRSTILRNDG
jgi:hypothetical protein